MSEEDYENLYLVQDPKTGNYDQISTCPDCKPMMRLFNTHNPKLCEGRNCTIHNNPSLHALTMEPLVWDEETAAVKRQCIHGFIHPDIDDLEYRKTVGQYHSYVSHDCDGCCGIELKDE
jgi:hypothetical protein